MHHPLKRHPDSLGGEDIEVEVEVTRPPGGLALTYKVTGAIGDLSLPPPGPPARAHELWQHTCFEAFLRAPRGETYYELNFAPSTQWAAYRLSGYRSGMQDAEIAPPRIEIEARPERYTLSVALAVDPLLAPSPPDRGVNDGAPWRLGLSAMIEDRRGRKSYWALKHPVGKPDFHHADCFALELD